MGLIPCADGGSAMSEWQPGELLYDNAIAQARLAQITSEIVGILWHQGESDSEKIEDVEAYHDRFMVMIETMMKDLELPRNTPVIVGELGEFVKDYKNGKLKNFTRLNGVLREISCELNCGGIASAKGLSCKYDGIHFTSESYRELGKRYFAEYLRIKG